MKMEAVNSPSTSSIVVHATYRGEKLSVRCDDTTTTLQLKCLLAQEHASSDESIIQPLDLKLFYKGKVMNDNDQLVLNVFGETTKTREFKILATGISKIQQQKNEQEIQDGIHRSKYNVKDDLTEFGQLAIRKRNQVGKVNLTKSANRILSQSKQKWGFGTIETLQGFPHESTAQSILQILANDPGIIACMTKHQWYVPVLAELYPEGQVGISDECVMGYNTNNGQLIKLRLRTDDLQGFRKVLSIRKTLYHELAHNVYSDHDDNFFRMMRLIENECNEYDWTKGAGLSNVDNTTDHVLQQQQQQQQQLYDGGSYRLGHGQETKNDLDLREQAARAAELRLRKLSDIHNDVDMLCGCVKNTEHNNDIFLPKSLKTGGSSSLQHDSEMNDNTDTKHTQR